MMTDPIADMLTRMRNALRNRRGSVTVPTSRVKLSILEVLKREGFIEGFEAVPSEGVRKEVRIELKYGPEGENIISHLYRVSKSGRRVYLGAGELKPARGGNGMRVVTSSVGVLSDREARAKNVGGEVVLEVW